MTKSKPTKLKMVFGADVRIVFLADPPRFDALMREVHAQFGLNQHHCRITTTDEENEVVTLSDTASLVDVLRAASARTGTASSAVPRFTIIPVTGGATSPPSASSPTALAAAALAVTASSPGSSPDTSPLSSTVSSPTTHSSRSLESFDSRSSSSMPASSTDGSYSTPAPLLKVLSIGSPPGSPPRRRSTVTAPYHHHHHHGARRDSTDTDAPLSPHADDHEHPPLSPEEHAHMYGHGSHGHHPPHHSHSHSHDDVYGDIPRHLRPGARLSLSSDSPAPTPTHVSMPFFSGAPATPGSAAPVAGEYVQSLMPPPYRPADERKASASGSRRMSGTLAAAPSTPSAAGMTSMPPPPMSISVSASTAAAATSSSSAAAAARSHVMLEPHEHKEPGTPPTPPRQLSLRRPKEASPTTTPGLLWSPSRPPTSASVPSSPTDSPLLRARPMPSGTVPPSSSAAHAHAAQAHAHAHAHAAHRRSASSSQASTQASLAPAAPVSWSLFSDSPLASGFRSALVVSASPASPIAHTRSRSHGAVPPSSLGLTGLPFESSSRAMSFHPSALSASSSSASSASSASASTPSAPSPSFTSPPALSISTSPSPAASAHSSHHSSPSFGAIHPPHSSSPTLTSSPATLLPPPLVPASASPSSFHSHHPHPHPHPSAASFHPGHAHSHHLSPYAHSIPPHHAHPHPHPHPPPHHAHAHAHAHPTLSHPPPTITEEELLSASGAGAGAGAGAGSGSISSSTSGSSSGSSSSSSGAASASGSPMRECIQFARNGVCPRGVGCTFKHSARRSRPCKYFLRGRCVDDAKCDFSHSKHWLAAFAATCPAATLPPTAPSTTTSTSSSSSASSPSHASSSTASASASASPVSASASASLFSPFECALCGKHFTGVKQKQQHEEGREHKHNMAVCYVNSLLGRVPFTGDNCFNCGQLNHKFSDCSFGFCRFYANRECRNGAQCALPHIGY